MRLLFVTSNRLGDAVLSTGLLGHLLDRHPDARVTVVSGPAPSALFNAVPGLERQIVLRKKPMHRHWFSLWAQLVATRWDVAVDLRRSALLPMLVAGQKLVVPKTTGMLHRVALLGETIGRRDTPPAPRLWMTDTDVETAKTILRTESGPVLAIGPTANWPGKVWPADRFVAVAEKLTGPKGPLPNARIAVFGAPGEENQAGKVMKALPPDRTIDLVGRVPLPVVGACLEKCALYIGNDSGLMHMAAAAGAPTLGLFGPSHTSLYAPWGNHTLALRTPEAYDELVGGPGYNRHTVGSLMTGLKAETVIGAAETLLHASATRALSGK